MHWIVRELVPADSVPPPADATLVTEFFSRGLPVTIALDQDLALVVVVPTGVATTWRDADPLTVIANAPARVILRSRAGGVLAAVPVVAGRTYRGLGARLDLTIRGWDLRAGAMRGPGDTVSRIDFAWRRADRAADSFVPPPVSQIVIDRIIASNPYLNLGGLT